MNSVHLKHVVFHQTKGKPPFTRQCSGVFHKGHFTKGPFLLLGLLKQVGPWFTWRFFLIYQGKSILFSKKDMPNFSCEVRVGDEPPKARRCPGSWAARRCRSRESQRSGPFFCGVARCGCWRCVVLSLFRCSVSAV